MKAGKISGLLSLKFFLVVAVLLHITNGQISITSCLDVLRSGSTKNGFYKTTCPSYPLTIFCDLESEPGSAWTLVMSSEKRYRASRHFRDPLPFNKPLNEKTPNFEVYRMTKDHMEILKSRSTHWRVTCSTRGKGHTMDSFYRDYLRVSFSSLNPLEYYGAGKCKKVDYINVRGHIGTGTAAFWQLNSKLVEMLHHDSSINMCEFGNTPGAVGSEDNFGLYLYQNSNFRCSQYENSTSELWFGGYDY